MTFHSLWNVSIRNILRFSILKNDMCNVPLKCSNVIVLRTYFFTIWRLFGALFLVLLDWSMKGSPVLKGGRCLRGLVMKYGTFHLKVFSSDLPQVQSDIKSLPLDSCSIDYVKWACDFRTKWTHTCAIQPSIQYMTAIVIQISILKEKN